LPEAFARDDALPRAGLLPDCRWQAATQRMGRAGFAATREAVSSRGKEQSH